MFFIQRRLLSYLYHPDGGLCSSARVLHFSARGLFRSARLLYFCARSKACSARGLFSSTSVLFYLHRVLCSSVFDSAQIPSGRVGASPSLSPTFRGFKTLERFYRQILKLGTKFVYGCRLCRNILINLIILIAYR